MTTRTPVGEGRRLGAVLAVATIGGFLFGYDTGVINGALEPMREDLGLDALGAGLVTSALLVGAALGAAVGGRVADRVGRRRAILGLAVVFFVGALACVAAIDQTTMIAARALLGVAVGGASVTVPVYLAEIAPTECRGVLAGRNELLIVVGQLAAFVVNAVLGLTLGHVDGVWRLMLGVSALPAAVLFVGMLGRPESPRWLVLAGRDAEAEAVLERLRPPGRAANEVAEIRASVGAAPERAPLSALLERRVLQVVAIGAGIAVAQQLTGINAILYYGQRILRDAGFDADGALLANIAPGAIGVLGTLIGLRLMAFVPRRTMLLAGFASTTALHVLIGAAAWLIPDGATARPFVVLALVVLFVGAMQTFLNVTTWVLLSEMFPQRVRGAAIGVAVCLHWLANAGVSVAFPSVVDAAGIGATFLIFAGIGAVVLVFLARFAPETAGRSLEEVEAGVLRRG